MGDKTITLHIAGTHCESCKAVIEDIASEQEGVTSCQVDFATGTTVITHTPEFDIQKFKQEVDALGTYTVELPKE